MQLCVVPGCLRAASFRFLIPSGVLHLASLVSRASAEKAASHPIIRKGRLVSTGPGANPQSMHHRICCISGMSTSEWRGVGHSRSRGQPPIHVSSCALWGVGRSRSRGQPPIHVSVATFVIYHLCEGPWCATAWVRQARRSQRRARMQACVLSHISLVCGGGSPCGSP